MTSTVDRLVTIFLGLSGTLALLFIGYCATPCLPLLIACWVVGAFTGIAGLAAAIFWAISTTPRA